MDAPAVLPYEPLSHLRTDGSQLIALAVDHGLDRPVPTCPGWDLGDLAWHVGGVWNRFAEIVSRPITTADAVRALPRPPRPGDDDLVIDWVTSAHTALCSALTRADPDDEVWTWAGPQQIHWVLRRMVQETAVHRWDAAHAVGIPYELPVAVAADGIDEFLMWFAGDRREGAAPVDGTIHLHCTDVGDDVTEGSDDRSQAIGEWLVTGYTDDRAVFTRQHAKGDAAVRGPAHELLLWCWRRDAGPVEIIGDAAVAERFRTYADL